MLNDDTPVGAPISVPTPEDANAASRGGDAAPFARIPGENPEQDDSTRAALGEAKTDAGPASHDPAIHWLVDAPPTPTGPNWIDQVLGQVARKAAIREGLVEATPFDRPGPVYMNLDHLPQAEAEAEAAVDPARLNARGLAVLPYACRDGAYMRAVRKLSDADFEDFVAHLDELDQEIPF